MYYKILILLLVIYLIYQLYEKQLNNYNSLSLEKDGFIIIKNVNDIFTILPEGYAFLDYIYDIKGCTLQTFHRDVTSSKYYYKTKYPVYTYIVYFNKGDLLSVCPNSHNTTPYVWSSPKIIKSNSNVTGILFNCDLVHSGAMNNLGKERHAIQFKIAHKNDFHKLKHLQSINKSVSNECYNKSFIKDYLFRKFSLFFSFIIKNIFTKYLQENQNNAINSLFLNIFGKEFYNK